MQVHVVKNYFDGWAKRYERDLAAFGYSVADHVAGATQGEHVLDLGVGTGLCARAYKQRVGSACLVGVDVSQRMLDVCRANGGVDALVQADIARSPLPFGDETFDSVMCGGVSEFMADPAFMIQQAFRVLKAGGIFVMAFEGTEGAGMYRYTRVRAHYVRVLRFGLLPRPSAFYKYLHSVQAMRQMCEDAGFSVLRADMFHAYRRKGGQDVSHWLLVCTKR